MFVELKNISIEHGDSLLEAMVRDECITEDLESSQCASDSTIPSWS